MQFKSLQRPTVLLTGFVVSALLTTLEARAQWMPYLWGEEVKAGLALLAEAETVTCTFGPGHMTKWQAGQPETEDVTSLLSG
jgi:hypothetical protein